MTKKSPKPQNLLLTLSVLFPPRCYKRCRLGALLAWLLLLVSYWGLGKWRIVSHGLVQWLLFWKPCPQKPCFNLQSDPWANSFMNRTDLKWSVSPQSTADWSLHEQWSEQFGTLLRSRENAFWRHWVLQQEELDPLVKSGRMCQLMVSDQLQVIWKNK